MNPKFAQRPDLCPDCLAAGVIATRTGPTCTHKANAGAAWFPAWWGNGPFDNGGEARRIAWLTKLNPA